MRFGLFQLGAQLNELGVPPCWRAYFLLLRQKKVAKEKATPGYAVGCANSPALLETGGVCGTRATPSDSPRPLSASFSVARRSTRGPKGVTCLYSFRAANCYGQPKKKPKNLVPKLSPDVFPGPLRGAEQRRRAGGFRLALFEPKASLASRPACRVAQGAGAAGTDPGVAFSLATFFWPSKRKYARPQGGTPSQLTKNK
jgi:hypothetical protein